MSGMIESRLRDLGIVLPTPPRPAANYAPTKRSGNLIFVSGQVPVIDGKDQYVGKLGREMSVADGQAAARLCGINLLAQLKLALNGDLSRVSGCVRLNGFVNAVPDFTEHPLVVNGASELMVAVFGAAGQHTRIAVGCSSLPRGVAVEVDGIFELAEAP